MKYFIKIHHIKNKGFTIAELIIGLAVFSLIIAAASGVFISAIKAQREALAWQELLDQTSYLEERISRTLRMAKKDVPGDCIAFSLNYEKTNTRLVEGEPRSGPGIKFKNYKGECMEVFLDDSDSRLKEKNFNNGTVLPLTSDRLKVNIFNIQGDNILGENTWDQNDDFQPRVTLFLEIEGREEGVEQAPKIKIQTTVSQRDLDVEY